MRTSFPSREELAVELADSGRIVRSADAWLVPSLGSQLVYRVTWANGSAHCTCPDFQRRQRECKHIIAAAIEAKRLESEKSEEK